jgi:hypothetical protein
MHYAYFEIHIDLCAFQFLICLVYKSAEYPLLAKYAGPRYNEAI